jgi:hypothetical protein
VVLGVRDEVQRKWSLAHRATAKRYRASKDVQYQEDMLYTVHTWLGTVTEQAEVGVSRRHSEVKRWRMAWNGYYGNGC